MSFREKSAWIAVLSTLVIWGYYFGSLWQSYAAGALDGTAVRNLFVVCFGVTIVVMLGLNLVSAWLGHHRFGADPDEREREMELRAKSVEAGLLEIMALGVALGVLFAAAPIAAAYPADPVGAIAIVAANGILLAVLLSQVLHELALIVQFRMMG
jgi:hypothetical protein